MTKPSRLIVTTLCGLLCAAGSSFAADVVTPGLLKFEVYNNISGTPVQGLLDDPKFPNSPDAVSYLTAFDTRTLYADDTHENFGGRISGLVTPVESGDYEFFLRSDDSSQLFISTDSSLANLSGSPIAEEAGCCNAFQESGAAQTSLPVALVAGKSYWIQALYKEGTGGDFCQVAWRKVGDTTPAAQLKPIPGAFLSVPAPAAGPITITKQPTAATAAQNDSVTFSLDATSAQGPVVVQWQKNGVSIPGLTGRTIKYGPLQASDSGAKIRALVSSPGAVATSDEVAITVTPDVTPPKIASILGSDTFDTVTVDFSEAVTPASAGSASSYLIDGGLTVSGVTVVSPTQVRLATSKQTSGAVYSLTLKNIVDTAGLSSAPDSKASFTAFSPVRGGLKLEAFYGISGTPVQNLLDDPKYQANTPDFVGYVSAFTSRLVFPDNDSGLASRDNYGGRLSGWIVPTDTAQYEFFLRSDDASQLFLSTDDKPENAIMIAEETSCCNPFSDPGAAQTSEAKSLTAGKRYYVYAIWKEGGGGDYCDVAWRKVGDTAAAKSLTYIPGSVLETYAAPETFTLPTVAISSPGNGDSFDPGTAVTLTATATAASGKNIKKVEFYEQANKVGEATSSPFSVTLSDLSEDAHVFTARATDSAGIFASSAPVSISVGGLKEKVTLLAIDDKTTWKYDRSATDLGTAWKDKVYDDSKWPEGKALIADESTTTVEPIRTAINRFNDAGDHVTTFYYRTHFTFNGTVSPSVKLQLRHVVDDGAVFYLNGVEINRLGIAADATFDFSTFFADHENAYAGPFDIPASLLVPGDNVLAAEVHQASSGSSDTVFGAELVATVPVVPVVATLVAIDDKTTFRYDRSGEDLGTAWKDKSFDDSKWPEGKTLIADESTTTVEPIRTAINRFNDAGDHVTTFYYRTRFNFDGEPAKVTKLRLRHVVDDGAVFYLNGVEINRLGIAADATFDYSTFFADHENAYAGPFDIPTSLLTKGENVLAAEVHQASSGSSDTVFGAELIVTYTGSSTGEAPHDAPSFDAPKIQGGNLVLSWKGTGALQTATDINGTWTDVTNATSPLTIQVIGPRKFYRLR